MMLEPLMRVCAVLEYEVIWGHIGILVVAVRRLSTYPAKSLRLSFPTKSPPHLHQPLNPPIKLGNFNIWSNYLIVYDL